MIPLQLVHANARASRHGVVQEGESDGMGMGRVYKCHFKYFRLGTATFNFLVAVVES